MASSLRVLALTRPRRKRRALTMDEKMQVLDLINNGKTRGQIAKDFAISKTQVRNICESSDRIKRTASEGSVPLKSKLIVHMSKHPELDRSVYEWFCRVRNPHGRRKPLPVSRAAVQARAVHEARLRGITDFRASDGWFQRWRWRCDVGTSEQLHGEISDFDLVESQRLIQELHKSIANGEYALSNVFNVDEASLFYRAMPMRNYVGDRGDVSNAAHAAKSLKGEDRVTLVLCLNATGTCKVEPLMIGTVKEPQSFRNSSSPIPYTYQPNAWCDKPRYRHWWYNVLLPCVRRWTSDPVALIVGHSAGHDRACRDPRGQVALFYLPPSATPMYQPFDQGVTSTLKTDYKCRLMTKVVETIGRYDELRTLAQDISGGRRGLAYGYPAHVLDAAELLKECWDALEPPVVAACWMRSHCLPMADTTTTVENQTDAIKTNETNAVRQMCALLSGLSNAASSDAAKLQELGLAEVVAAASGDGGPQDCAPMLLQWLDLENDLQVLAADEVSLIEQVNADLDAVASEVVYTDVEAMQQAEADAVLGIVDGVNQPASSRLPQHVPVDRMALLQRAVAHASDLHAVAGQLDDPIMLELTMKLSFHVGACLSAAQTKVT